MDQFAGVRSAAALIIAATGGPNVGAFAVAGACLLTGFLGLAVTGTSESPLRPMRLALAISIPPTAFMLAGLSWPPREAERGSFVALILGLTLSVSASLLARRHPRVTVGVLLALAAYAMVMLGRFGGSFLSTAKEWNRLGPAITLAYLLAASVAIAWVAAFWHARTLWRSLVWVATAQPNER